MNTSVLTKVPHRWRYIGFVTFACVLVYTTFHYMQVPAGKMDYVLERTGVPADRILFFDESNEQISNRIHGIDNFESNLPRIQFDFSEESENSKHVRETRRDAIKSSFLHGWNGYKKYALGADELKPLTNTSSNPFGGLGATMIDSLSTILVMGLDDELEELLPLIENIKVKVDEQMSVFETIIRYMGGLLSAYELSDHPGKRVLLDKAEEIGLALLPAFDTTYGLPHYHFNPFTRVSKTNTTYLADAGTIQLEFFTLSYHTGNLIFAEKAQAITDFLDSADESQGVTVPGLYPYAIDISEGEFNKDSSVSFGAMGDSAYEYFLKQYILVDGRIPQFARMCTYNLKELHTCFAPGMLAMGAKIFNRPDDMQVAKGLLDTCVHMYRSSYTNLSPELWGVADEVEAYDPLTYEQIDDDLTAARSWRLWGTGYLNPTESAETRVLKDVETTPSGVIAYDTRYLLRPETVESLYILYRITGDPVYREYGWVIYEGLEKHCRTSSAYASIKNVNTDGTESGQNQIDSMETFLFAETFKYLYLLFSPPEVVSLDKFVLNTEAHPLLRRPWTLNLKNNNKP
ncbi:hypothetical protein INT47_012270 [Mucor saturninus]|uniref:alpha-1,2-Mannosidase n=1 Tax=Mucor saturninus TaxID=64648 RepID=A0A8H7V6E5_9FUNG|nr:hypothetical protein INT47_012270 [Mucor saturninus]